MITSSLDTSNGILYVRPAAPLAADDFVKLAQTVDPWIENNGKLKALIIEAPQFPGWDSFDALLNHFRFVLNHHQHIRKVGVVTDSTMGGIAEKFGSHFLAAQIKRFPAGEIGEARRWALT